MVGELADGEEAVAAVSPHPPAVVMMDVAMPVLDGLEVTARILAADGGGCRVIILTTFDIDEYVFAAPVPAPAGSAQGRVASTPDRLGQDGGRQRRATCRLVCKQRGRQHLAPRMPRNSRVWATTRMTTATGESG